LICIAIIMIITACCHVVNESYDKAKKQTKEDALETALRYTRQAIRDYTDDHGKPPHHLEDLVTSGYFNTIPIDPMTNKADWSVEFVPCVRTAPCEKLIKDIHSSSIAKSSKDNLYSEW